MKRKE